jgi:DNA-directed RNA polymerase alpha subunit
VLLQLMTDPDSLVQGFLQSDDDRACTAITEVVAIDGLDPDGWCDVAQLQLDPRPYNALRGRGIRYIEQLTAMSRSELAALRGIGARSLLSIEFALAIARR